MCRVNGGLGLLQVNGSHIQAPAIIVAMIAFWRYVMDFHDLVALQCFKVDVEAPQAVQVLENFVGRVAQRFAVVLLVAQGQ